MAEDRRLDLPEDNIFRHYNNTEVSISDNAEGELTVKTSFESERTSLSEAEIRQLFRAMDAPGTSTKNVADARRRFW